MLEENLSRARYIADEIKACKHNIDTLKYLIKQKEDTSIRIQEHNDGSGWSLKPIYLDGNHPKVLNLAIHNALLIVYTKHLTTLMAELENL